MLNKKNYNYTPKNKEFFHTKIQRKKIIWLAIKYHLKALSDLICINN